MEKQTKQNQSRKESQNLRMVTFRLEDDLNQKLLLFAKTDGRSKSSAIKKIISDYFNHSKE